MMQNFLLQVLRLRLMVCGIYIIIMEDYILREIDKIGKLIEALLQKAGILRRSGAGEAVCETAWTELAEALDLDIDTLLAREDFIGVLIREYGFSDENLEKFAELLFDFAAASPGPARLRHYGHLPLSGRKEGSGFPEPLLHPQGVGEYDCPIARRRRTVAIPVCAG